MILWVESRRAGRGIATAFEILWHRHREKTRRALVRILGARKDLAEDVLQEAWLEVARADGYERGSFRSFIRTVAIRKALDRIASAAVRSSACAALGGLGTSPGERPRSAQPDALAHANEAASMIIELAERLPRSQWEAWRSRYLGQLTFGEVAAASGIPLGTAKTRVRRANEALASALGARGVARADLLADG